ncbi:unnamed protein product [Soboliphyme baturini]|uniref:Dual specificity protein phosphatase 19 n=1 Tax=Soboliphyme baturini TaxID=241478 RepID=A0A183IKB1_9BILA|nr:unnamed protein product [Soboliphyme baturini]
MSSLGSQDVAADFELLLANGITHILNVSFDVPNYFENHFTYLHCPLLDDEKFDLTSFLDGCLKFIEDALSSGGSVFVHCNAGISRSVAVAIAYLMHAKRIPFEDAFQHIRACRPRAQPNAGFIAQLQQIEFKPRMKEHC